MIKMLRIRTIVIIPYFSGTKNKSPIRYKDSIKIATMIMFLRKKFTIVLNSKGNVISIVFII
jgi:hypothetical protein